MNNVQKLPTGRADPRLRIVELAWESYNPWQIAELINTKYGYRGVFRWTERHVENAHQTIARLDREAQAGR